LLSSSTDLPEIKNLLGPEIIKPPIHLHNPHNSREHPDPSVILTG